MSEIVLLKKNQQRGESKRVCKTYDTQKIMKNHLPSIGYQTPLFPDIRTFFRSQISRSTAEKLKYKSYER